MKSGIEPSKKLLSCMWIRLIVFEKHLIFFWPPQPSPLGCVLSLGIWTWLPMCWTAFPWDRDILGSRRGGRAGGEHLSEWEGRGFDRFPTAPSHHREEFTPLAESKQEEYRAVRPWGEEERAAQRTASCSKAGLQGILTTHQQLCAAGNSYILPGLLGVPIAGAYFLLLSCWTL